MGFKTVYEILEEGDTFLGDLKTSEKNLLKGVKIEVKEEVVIAP